MSKDDYAEAAPAADPDGGAHVAASAPPAAAEPGRDASRLTLDLVQIVGDELFAGNRQDGTGFAMYPAPSRRQWMEETKLRYAYRCLPLAMANQLGYWLTNPVGFSVTWDGGHHQSALRLAFDRDAPLWSRYISSIFGHGILTWNMPFMFRTHPAGSQILVTPPANRFKSGAQALQAIIETDWMTSSFTMNWRLLQSGTAVRFEAGEPILQALPLLRDQVHDLEALDVFVSGRQDDPATFARYEAWMRGRDKFRAEQTASGGDGWQKDYFQGKEADGSRQTVRDHHTKLRSRPIQRGERLGLDGPPLPAEEDLTRTAARPGVVELRVGAGDSALPHGQDGEALVVHWPSECTLLWRGGLDFELTADPALGARLRSGPEAGQVLLDTGLRLGLPAGYRGHVRPAPRASALLQLREGELDSGAQDVPLILVLQCLRTDVAAMLRPGPLACVTLRADQARLRLVPGG